MDIKELNDSEVVRLYSETIKELKRRKIIRTNNVIGDLGEYQAISHYNNTPGLPNLSPAAVGTENIDAISRKGDRYSIKSTSGTSTGVFFGLEPEGSGVEDEKKFEYVIICKFDRNYELQMILEIDWNTFMTHKKWHKRMNAWYISINKQLKQNGKIIYEKQ